ncbi:MAG TPA: PA2169 family four-helix-bundle protein [Dyella sp.]|uniref:PA2169 family four-helix-bundle protein n=1 Tax=Dyella sp. TaxID=1869338 RepID=UPI002F938CEC
MSQNDHDIKVINGLIAATIDSEEGYREAAKEAENPMFRDLFQDWSAERRQVAIGLQQVVASLGGDPEDDGTALASVHRVFVDLRASMSKGDKAVVAEVERGEDHIKAKFEEALSDEKLAPLCREAVQAAFVSVRQGHDEMRDLKRGMEQ